MAVSGSSPESLGSGVVGGNRLGEALTAHAEVNERVALQTTP
jgi:hypothetical protein